VARRLRKHRTALLALAVYNFVLFFPVAFLGRAVSPNDVFYNYYPWSTVRPPELVQTQNSTINDPPTAYFTLMSLARDDWRTFHWNPYIASGVPGFGSSASAILSPFILIPTLVVPEAWIYTAILFLKLNASFLFAYFWLREEKLGRNGAAVGALVVAGAGVYAVRWLWQITNATALYPALLWIVRRTLNGKRNSIALMALVALAYALAGFPAAMAYGAWIAVVYVLAFVLVERRALARRGGFGGLKTAAPLLAVAIALLISLPSLVPFAQFLNRSGYLEARRTSGVTQTFPREHVQAFINPDRLGHPAFKDWRGDPRLGPLNNYTETCIYLGLLTLPLVLLGIFNRRAQARWFWLATAAVVIAAMFGFAPWLARLPGFKFSALARVSLLLPLAIGYLAASGTRLLRKELIAGALAVLMAFDLALVAGRFYPYLQPESTKIPATPTMQFLRAEKGPFRIAPFFDYFWPNTAEYVRVEDVRSHFGSELAYRRMLTRLDPTAWSGSSTVLTFNSIKFNFTDPLAGLLGIRWYIEHNVIDIIKWTIFSNTRPGVRELGAGLPFKFNQTFERTIAVADDPFWAIELPCTIEQQRGPEGHLQVTLLKNGAAVWSRAFTKGDAEVMGKVYIPLRPYARLGETVVLRVRANGVQGLFSEGEGKSFYWGRVTVPVIFERELPDGRLFRNLAELPRFRAVSKLRKLNDDEFLAARDVDFATEAVITDDPVAPPQLGAANARVTLAHYAPDEQRVITESDAPFFLASSEKLTPELRVTLDGKEARALKTDMLFAGVTVPAGRHELVFSRRIARGWWGWAMAGVVLLLLAAVYDIYGLRRRKSPL
jgi:hypothetical protein